MHTIMRRFSASHFFAGKGRLWPLWIARGEGPARHANCYDGVVVVVVGGAAFFARHFSTFLHRSRGSLIARGLLRCFLLKSTPVALLRLL